MKVSNTIRIRTNSLESNSVPTKTRQTIFGSLRRIYSILITEKPSSQNQSSERVEYVEATHNYNLSLGKTASSTINITSQHQEASQIIPQIKIEDLELSEHLKKADVKGGCTTQIKRLLSIINQKGISKSDIQDIEAKLDTVITRINSSKLTEDARKLLISTLTKKVMDHLDQKIKTQNKVEMSQILFDQLVKQLSDQTVDQSRHLTKNIHQVMGDTTANLESAIILLTNDHNPITPSYLGQSTVNAKGFWGRVKSVYHFGIKGKSIHTFDKPSTGKMSLQKKSKDGNSYSLFLSTSASQSFSVNFSMEGSEGDQGLTLDDESKKSLANYLKDTLRFDESYSIRDDVQKCFLSHLINQTTSKKNKVTFSSKPNLSLTKLAIGGAVLHELAKSDLVADDLKEATTQATKEAADFVQNEVGKAVTNAASKVGWGIAKAGIKAGLNTITLGGVGLVADITESLVSVDFPDMPKLPKLELDIGDILNIDISTFDSQIEDFMKSLPPGVNANMSDKLKSFLESIKENLQNAVDAKANELKALVDREEEKIERLKDNPLVSIYKYMTSSSLERKFLMKIFRNLTKNTDIQELDSKQVLNNVGEYKHNGGLVLKESGDIGVNVRKKGLIPVNMNADKFIFSKRLFIWGSRALKVSTLSAAVTTSLVSIGVVGAAAAWPVTLGIVGGVGVGLAAIAIYSWATRNEPPTRGMLKLPSSNPGTILGAKQLIEILQFLPDKQIQEFGSQVLGKENVTRQDLKTYLDSKKFQEFKDLVQNTQGNTISYAHWYRQLQTELVEGHASTKLNSLTSIRNLSKQNALERNDIDTQSVSSTWQESLKHATEVCVDKKTLGLLATAVLSQEDHELNDNFVRSLSLYLHENPLGKENELHTFLGEIIKSTKNRFSSIEKYLDPISQDSMTSFVDKYSEQIKTQLNELQHKQDEQNLEANKQLKEKGITSAPNKGTFKATMNSEGINILLMDTKQFARLEEKINQRRITLNSEITDSASLRDACLAYIELQQLQKVVAESTIENPKLERLKKDLTNIPLPKINDMSFKESQKIKGLIKELFEGTRTWSQTLTMTPSLKNKLSQYDLAEGAEKKLIEHLNNGIKQVAAKSKDLSMVTRLVVQGGKSSAGNAVKSLKIDEFKQQVTEKLGSDQSKNFESSGRKLLRHHAGSTKSIEDFAKAILSKSQSATERQWLENAIQNINQEIINWTEQERNGVFDSIYKNINSDKPDTQYKTDLLKLYNGLKYPGVGKSTTQLVLDQLYQSVQDGDVLFSGNHILGHTKLSTKDAIALATKIITELPNRPLTNEQKETVKTWVDQLNKTFETALSPAFWGTTSSTKLDDINQLAELFKKQN